MTDSEPAGISGTEARPGPGRHRAAGKAPAAPATAGWLPRTALVGLGVVALAAGVLAAATAADTPARPAGAQPGSTSPVTGAQRLSVGAPPGAQLLPAMPVHVSHPAPATPGVVSALAANGIPAVALNAYRLAAARLASAQPGCGVALVAAGRRSAGSRSNHGRYGGATLTAAAESRPPIIGPGAGRHQLSPTSPTPTAAGWTATPGYDHAVGPMQFIPSTWAQLRHRRQRRRRGQTRSTSTTPRWPRPPLPVRGRRRPATAAGQPARCWPTTTPTSTWPWCWRPRAPTRPAFRWRAGPGPGHRAGAGSGHRLAAAGESGPASRNCRRARPTRPAGARRAAGQPAAVCRPAAARPAVVRRMAVRRPAAAHPAAARRAGVRRPAPARPAAPASRHRPAPHLPSPEAPSGSPSQPGQPGLPLPSVSVPTCPAVAHQRRCTQVVLGIGVPVPCGP